MFIWFAQSVHRNLYLCFDTIMYIFNAPCKVIFFFFNSTHYLTGAPSAELLESPVTSMDHPFLKAFEGPSSSAQTISQIAGDKLVG